MKLYFKKIKDNLSHRFNIFTREISRARNEFTYSSGKIPPKYKCGYCKAFGLKLWREYSTFDPQLLCAVCALKDQKKSYSVDSVGKHDDLAYGSSDQIGSYVPAIPDEEAAGYWGYTSVPQEGINWWKKLVTYK
jgi:hypothetical protein